MKKANAVSISASIQEELQDAATRAELALKCEPLVYGYVGDAFCRFVEADKALMRVARKVKELRGESCLSTCQDIPAGHHKLVGSAAS